MLLYKPKVERSLGEWEQFVASSLTNELNYREWFYKIWELLAKNEIVWEPMLVCQYRDAISILSPPGIYLPFYIWSSTNPVYAGIEVGINCVHKLLGWKPTTVNIFLTLCMLTSSGRLGVGINDGDLETLSQVSTKKIMSYLGGLREERYVIWGFVDKTQTDSRATGVHSKRGALIKVFWLNREKILL